MTGLYQCISSLVTQVWFLYAERDYPSEMATAYAEEKVLRRPVPVQVRVVG
jgi:hypothetical protein